MQTLITLQHMNVPLCVIEEMLHVIFLIQIRKHSSSFNKDAFYQRYPLYSYFFLFFTGKTAGQESLQDVHPEQER